MLTFITQLIVAALSLFGGATQDLPATDGSAGSAIVRQADTTQGQLDAEYIGGVRSGSGGVSTSNANAD